MSNNNGNIFSKKQLSPDLWPVIIGALLLLLTALGVSSVLSPSFSILFDPMAYYGDKVGENVNVAKRIGTEIGTLRKDNDALLAENIRLEAENSLYQVINQENESLREQLDLGREDVELIAARVVFYDPAGYLTLSVGARDGVENGQVAVIGNAYIGRISQVLPNSSKVQLPLSGDSVLEVYIGERINPLTNGDDLNERITQIAKEFVRGSARGSQKGIVVENITQKAVVEEGDYVLINDIKVDDVLFLGSISDVNDDPTLPEQAALVEPFLNYEELTSLFIIK